MADDLLPIGDVALRAGVAASAIRFYEQHGLLEPAARGPNGRRRYRPGAVARVEVIVDLADVGFTIAEIAELLAGADASPAAWRRLVERKIDELDGRLRRVRATRAALHGALDDPAGLYPALVEHRG